MEWWPLVRCFPRTCPAGDVCGVPFYFTSQSPGLGRDHWARATCPQPRFSAAMLEGYILQQEIRVIGRDGGSLWWGLDKQGNESAIAKPDKGAEPESQALGQVLSPQLWVGLGKWAHYWLPSRSGQPKIRAGSGCCVVSCSGHSCQPPIPKLTPEGPIGLQRVRFIFSKKPSRLPRDKASPVSGFLYILFSDPGDGWMASSTQWTWV